MDKYDDMEKVTVLFLFQLDHTLSSFLSPKVSHINFLMDVFLYVSLTLGLYYVSWASQECCLFYLRLSLRSSDLPLI